MTTVTPRPTEPKVALREIGNRISKLSYRDAVLAAELLDRVSKSPANGQGFPELLMKWADALGDA